MKINMLWTEELSETCRFSCQNKFVKLVHLIGFIKKKPCHNVGSDGKRTIFSYLQRLDIVSSLPSLLIC